MDPLFVFLNKTGEVRVEPTAVATALEKDPAWRHIASLEPRVYLQYVFDHNPALVTALEASQGESESPRDDS